MTFRVIGDETALPYDRPELSKGALLSEEGERRVFIRDAAWYDAQRIDLRLGVRVESINRASHSEQLSDGARVAYKRLLLATGSRVRRFSGVVEEGMTVHHVRTVEDSRAPRAALAPGLRVAVLGGGFIGLEVAASARKVGCKVVLVEPAERLLMGSLPLDVSQFLIELHRTHGVDVRLGTKPFAIRHGVVETDSGDIRANVVVVGIGVLPNVELAQNQPAVAAANTLGASTCYAESPWLWSDQYDCNVQTLGVFANTHRLVVRGEPSSASFCVLALDDAVRIEAVCAVNAGRELAVCRRLIAANKPLEIDALRNPAISLRTLL